MTWRAPVYNGGAPMTNYIPELRKQGQFSWHRVMEREITKHEYFLAAWLDVEETQ